MAHQCGTKDNTSQSQCMLFAFGRSAGFVIFAAMGLSIVAALVLIPGYCRLLQVKYVNGCQKAAVADKQAYISAQELFARDCQLDDPILAKRQASSVLGISVLDSAFTRVNQFGTSPQRRASETRKKQKARKNLPPDIIRITSHDRPEKPAPWLMKIGEKLQTPTRRRGLWLLMAVAILAAMWLSGSPTRNEDLS